MTGLLIVLILYSSVFSLSELLYHRGLSAQLTRKLTHIGGALVSALLPLLVSLPAALGLGLFFRSF